MILLIIMVIIRADTQLTFAMCHQYWVKLFMRLSYLSLITTWQVGIIFNSVQQMKKLRPAKVK